MVEAKFSGERPLKDANCPPPVRGHQNLMRSLGLSAASMLVALVILELVVRVIEPREVMRYFFMSSDSVLHHRFIPGARGRYKTTEFDVEYRINALGLRDREIAAQRPAGTRRILMLGDSFTEGDGVEYEETFSACLQAMLDSTDLPERWEVINAGVGSYAPLVEYLYLTKAGLALEPDIVILNLDLSDFYDDTGYATLARYDARGMPVGVCAESEPAASGWVKASLIGMKDFAKEHTRLYNFVRLRIDRYLEGARHTVDMSGNMRFDKYAMLRPGARTDIEREGSITFGYIMAMRDTLRAHGVDFRVNVYPYGLQVSPGEWRAGRQYWGFRPDTLYGTEPQDRIAAILRGRGIPVSNLCEAFRVRAATVAPLYHDYNGHWKPAGHRLVAEQLYGFLLPKLKGRERP